MLLDSREYAQEYMHASQTSWQREKMLGCTSYGKYQTLGFRGLRGGEIGRKLCIIITIIVIKKDYRCSNFPFLLYPVCFSLA